MNKELKAKLTKKTKKRVAEIFTAKDIHVIKAVSLIEELDKMTNLISENAREWYSTHFPELNSLAEENDNYLKLVLIGDRKNFNEKNVLEAYKNREKVQKILEKSKDSLSIMGVRSSKDEKFNHFWMNWHRKRVELKKEARIIFSDRNTDYWKFFKNLKHTNIRELLHLSPSAIMIIDDNTFIFSYEKELTCIHINSKSITNSLLNFFEDLWKISKK